MLSVLIVDDEAPIRDWVEYCLKRQGGLTITGLAKNGEEALKMVKKESPEVIITDICMPGMNGLELMKGVKELCPYTEFIILTNYAEFSYAKEAISYGAREYLLKSEMRAEDLAGILNRIVEEKERIVSSKKEQRLPNGFMDLYEIYQAREETCQREFLQDIGFKNETAYEILCTSKVLPDTTAEAITELAIEEGLERCIPASRNEYLFLIVQDQHARKLKDSAKRIAQRLYERFNGWVGISPQHMDLLSFLTCVKEAVTAYEYRFFSDSQGILEYQELTKAPPLNFERVRAGYQEIQMNLSYKQYNEALENVDQWFSVLKEMRIQDSEWAAERCRRMVFMVEEQCCHLDPQEEGEARKSPQEESAKACRERCVKLIKRLFDKKNGQYSESIEKAIHYIHQNYNKDISLVDVAGIIFRSPEYFSRLFKEEVGENFSTYLMLYRLNHAREMLKKTDKKIAEISYAVGYSTQSYFSRLYKKYMGKTPEEERNQNKR